MTRRRACGGLVLALGVLLAIGPLTHPCPGGDDGLGAELPRIKPRGPGAALGSFRLHPGFRLEPAATEPLVTDPVSACYDADGRLYVVEMRGYPYPEKRPTGRVQRIEDADGDGRFDRGTVFLEGLSWPTGVVPYDGGVFVAAAPDILYAKDTDGDGVADVTRVVFTGFGTQNVQALLNGLLWGPDGWIYGVSGGNGGEIRNPAKPGAGPVPVRGRDFRFRPDGSAFEAVSGGGQFGHSFDDWGHRFTCNNSNHIRQIVLPSWYLERNPATSPPAVVADIAAEGHAAPVYRASAAEPWRVVRTRQRAADPATAKRLPPTELFATGFFTSATGVTLYRGNAFPPEYYGNAFIGDVGGNLVHRKTLSRHGAEFLATRADAGTEFLTSTDNWFRPVNFANTPDGTLLILDMYRETIEHPFSIPEPIKAHLDLTSGRDLGRLYELVPAAGVRRRRPAMSKATTAELVAHLGDPASWWRETARRLLSERPDPAAAVPLLREAARSRPNALARFHALGLLREFAADDESLIVAALGDPEPGVRELAARLCETHFHDGSAVSAPFLRLADDPDAMVRLQVAFSLGAMQGPAALDALAVLAQRDAGDRWVRAAVLSSSSHRAAPLLGRLVREERVRANGEGRAWLDELAAVVGAENVAEDVQSVVALATEPGVGVEPTRAVLLGLGRGLRRSGGSFRAWLDGPAGEALGKAFRGAAETALGDGPVGGRVEAVRLLALGPEPLAMATLQGLLDARQPTAVQLAAVQALSGQTDARVGPRITGAWKALSPAVRREALEALFARPERLGALLDAVGSKAVAASDLDPARRKALTSHPDPAVRDRALKLLGAAGPSDRARVLDAFRPALALSGDRVKGRAVFRKVCVTCHKAEGEGAEVGPDLATVAGRTPDDLLVHVLDPNREVAPNAVNYTVETAEGRVVSGMIVEESAGSVTLRRAEGVTETVPRARIGSITSTGLSLMPEGLEQGLTPRDLADLIAFVRGIAPAARP